MPTYITTSSNEMSVGKTAAAKIARQDTIISLSLYTVPFIITPKSLKRDGKTIDYCDITISDTLHWQFY